MSDWFDRRRRSRQDGRGVGYAGTTRTNAFIGIEDGGGGSSSAKQRADDLQENWQAEGLPSQHAAVLLAKIIDPTTTTTERSTYFAALAQFSMSSQTQAEKPSAVAFSGTVSAGLKRIGDGGGKDGGSKL